MITYSKSSQAAFDSCSPPIQKILLYTKDVLKIDHTVICGHRGEQEQNALYYGEPKRTHIKWPDGEHNVFPSNAVDVVPYTRLWNRFGGIHWHDKDPKIKESYYREIVRFAAIFQMVALLKFGIKTRWGGDWDKDWSLMDNKFNDYPHHELVEM